VFTFAPAGVRDSAEAEVAQFAAGDNPAPTAERQTDDNHPPTVAQGEDEMSGTQDSIGIKPDHTAEGIPKSDSHVYNGDLSGQRKSSKSATYPWTADVAVKASKVKSSGVKPID
jgi:hypothetical protein